MWPRSSSIQIGYFDMLKQLALGPELLGLSKMALGR